MPKSIISQLERYRRCIVFLACISCVLCSIRVKAADCGDADASGQVNIADVVSLVNYIFAGGSAPADEASGDFNCSNQTDIADAVYFISYVFASGPAPCDGPNCDTGVLLPGDDTLLAVAVTYDYGPFAADSADIDSTGLLRTKLSAILHPEATVGEVNAALSMIGGTITWMSPAGLAATVKIPAISTSSEADSLCGILVQTGAFLFVEPAYQNAISASVQQLELPASGIAGNDHLVLMRMPAAWNVVVHAENVNSPVTVHVPDFYYARQQHPQISAQTFVGTVGQPTTNPTFSGNHGFWISGLIGADHDDQISTGVFPGPNGLIQIHSQLLGGFTELEKPISSLFPAGRFVLTTSTEYAGGLGLLDGTTKISRFIGGVEWRIKARARMNDFIHISAAGNKGTNTDDSRWAYFASPANVAASVSNPWEMFAPGTIFFEDSLILSIYWAYVSNQYPLIENKMENVVMVGGSDDQGIEVPSSSRGSDVRALGVLVQGPCGLPDGLPPPNGCAEQGGQFVGRYGGTSAAAAQVSGLVAYLLALKPTLTNDEIKQILQNSFDHSMNPGIVDGYLAVQMLDQSIFDASIRMTLIDIAGTDGTVGSDGLFTEHDITQFLEQFAFYEDLRLTNGEVPDYSDWDLNGDGFTGGTNHISRFDLDINSPPQYTGVSIAAGGDQIQFDENLVVDLDVLCYYAHSPLYNGVDSLRDQLLVDCACSQVAARDAQCSECDVPIESLFEYNQRTGFVSTGYDAGDCPDDVVTIWLPSEAPYDFGSFVHDLSASDCDETSFSSAQLNSIPQYDTSVSRWTWTVSGNVPESPTTILYPTTKRHIRTVGVQAVRFMHTKLYRSFLL